MRFLFDQNFDRRLLPFLRSFGHDVTVVAIDYPPGIPDRQVLALAYAERRILLTNDRDFGEIAVSEQLPHAGIIYLRMRRVSAEAKRDRIVAVLRDHADQLDRFLSVSEHDVRIRSTMIVHDIHRMLARLREPEAPLQAEMVGTAPVA